MSTTTKNRVASTDKAAELHQKLEEGVAELVSGEDWQSYLATAARFHTYSMHNTFLIFMQRPDATRVAGFKTWQSMGRQVRKGEKGIAILAPSSRKVTETKDDGTEESRRIVTGFRVVYVFDIAQTEGDPIVETVRCQLVEGEAPEGLWDALAAQVTGSGFTLTRGDCGTANGWTKFDTNEVRVADSLSPAQACKTLAHELAHTILHREVDYHGCRGRWEVEAESVAYIVAAASGMDTDGYSLPYVAKWSAGDVSLVKETAERVVKTAKTILAAMEGGEDSTEIAA